MKYKGWGTRWEWDKEGEIYVYALEAVTQRDIEGVVTIINDVIREFALPLSVLNGNSVKSEDTALVEQLIAECSQEKQVDLDGVEVKLKEMRERGFLPYGVVILVDPSRYRLKTPRDSKQEPIYGYGTENGIIVLRRFDMQNAVRHEFGHMVGLGQHHPNCVMAWECSRSEFCNDCISRIEQMWGVKEGRSPS